MMPKEDVTEPDSGQRARRRGSFSLLRSFHRSRNKSLSRDVLNGNNNNNSAHTKGKAKYASVNSLSDRKENIDLKPSALSQQDISQSPPSQHNQALIVQRLVSLLFKVLRLLESYFEYHYLALIKPKTVCV